MHNIIKYIFENQKAKQRKTGRNMRKKAKRLRGNKYFIKVFPPENECQNTMFFLNVSKCNYTFKNDTGAYQ